MRLTLMNLCFCQFVSTMMAVQKLKFQRTPQLDDKTCTSKDLSFTQQAAGSMSCLVLCSLDFTCRSVFFNKETQSCLACKNKYESDEALVNVNGYKMYTNLLPMCPDEHWKRFKNSCYKFIPPDTFDSGVANCNADGGHAVYIETSEENEWIKSQLLNEDGGFYIGIKQFGTECSLNGNWMLYGTNKTIPFSDFYADDQSGTYECCAVIYTPFMFKWANVYCELPYQMICEFDLEP